MPYSKLKTEKFNFWSFLWSCLPAVTLHNDRHLRAFLMYFPADAFIVDVGSGGRQLSPDIITFDKFIANNTKVIGDIHNLPFKNESIDCIICTGTLEHIENPWIAVSEFYRVLKKRGKVYIATPFMQGYHPDPNDFWRFTEDGLIKLCDRFKRLDSGCLAGTGSGLSWALTDFFRALSDNRRISELMVIASRLLFFWVKYFDLAFARNRNNKYFASAYFFVGEKV